MEPLMTAIEMTGTIDENHQLHLDGTLPLGGPMRVKVIVLYPITDEPGETEWLQTATRNPAFSFLSEPEEDIYSLKDGKPLDDQE